MGIVLLRCDDRLIHGQCIVRILKDYKIDEIILVDAFTASNPVMKNIYQMSVPASVSLHLFAPSQEETIKAIDEAARGDGNTLVLVKGPVVALDLRRRTRALPNTLNIGPMSNRSNAKKMTFFASLLEDEVRACEELTNLGVRVYFQQVPGEKEVDWSEVI